jgi:hypothetical protein
VATPLQTSTTDNAEQTSFDTGNLFPRIRSASGSMGTAPNSCWCYRQTLAGAHNRAPHFGSLISFEKRATYFENAIISVTERIGRFQSKPLILSHRGRRHTAEEHLRRPARKDSAIMIPISRQFVPENRQLRVLLSVAKRSKRSPSADAQPPPLFSHWHVHRETRSLYAFVCNAVQRRNGFLVLASVESSLDELNVRVVAGRLGTAP